MTGRYLIYTPASSMLDEKRFDAQWRRFAEICRSLHHDGLQYTVEVNLDARIPHILVKASGKARPAVNRKHGTRIVPPPIPAGRCKERAIEAEWFLPENLGRRNDGTAYWRKHGERYKELCGMTEEFVRAEAEYWRELELLSGQRARFKPGLTDETLYQDEEVAA